MIPKDSTCLEICVGAQCKNGVLWVFVRKLQETTQKSLRPHFLPNKKLFLDYAFVPIPGLVDRSEFPSGYTLQQTIAICSYASMEKPVCAVCGLPLELDTWFMGLLLTSEYKLSDAPKKVSYCKPR